MSELARGGFIGKAGEGPPRCTHGCDYYIPREFAERWKDLLLRINEGLDTDEGDDVE